MVAVHFTREIIEDTEPCDVSLKDITPLEFPGVLQNDLWNITNKDTVDNNNNEDITEIYNTKLLSPGDAPPSNASLGEVELEDLEASLHEDLSCLLDLLLGELLVDCSRSFREDPLFSEMFWQGSHSLGSDTGGDRGWGQHFFLRGM